MSLYCSADMDGDGILDLTFIPSTDRKLKCKECYEAIPPGDSGYAVYEADYDEDGVESVTHVFDVCEDCGDLALSWFDMGFCWEYGSLRDDIAQAKAEGLV